MTNLAWSQLIYKKIRLGIALAGIAFADILVFIQLGFQSALLTSAVILHKQIKGDIFLLSTRTEALISMESFSRRRLYQTLGTEGVKDVHPLYISFTQWKNPVDGSSRSIMVLGFNPANRVLKFPGVRDNIAAIKRQDVILFDELSREEYGPVAELYRQGEAIETEVGDRRVTVGGIFSMGTSFGADGNLITSDINFLRLFPDREPGLIDIGVIQLEPDADPAAVLEQLRQQLPQDVLVFSRQEFINYEVTYWQDTTAIGFVFGLGTILGLVVGIVIVYQILYTDVAEHLPEYATLKAMGYGDRYLLAVVFQEAIILAILGFIPGASVSTALYLLASQATGLPLYMAGSRVATVLIMTILMCFTSGAIAVRKLQAADPAEIF